MTEEIGLLSGFLVILSAVPYAIRTYQGKIRPNLTSWGIWAILGLALLLTYKSSGATSNVWPAVFGFTNPCLITLLAFWKGERKWPNTLEVTCLIVGLASIILWYFAKETKTLSQYVLYVAIMADAVAAIPTIVFVWKEPCGDRPFAWAMFGVGYGLAIFAIEEYSFANYVLPVYMFVGATSIATILIIYRVRQKIPISQWI